MIKPWLPVDRIDYAVFAQRTSKLSSYLRLYVCSSISPFKYCWISLSRCATFSSTVSGGASLERIADDSVSNRSSILIVASTAANAKSLRLVVRGMLNRRHSSTTTSTCSNRSWRIHCSFWNVYYCYLILLWKNTSKLSSYWIAYEVSSISWSKNFLISSSR